ncbi:MAG: YqiA/YcfP family alpha/beta fold hydrolase [Burkholderiaceae bacterium]|nr:YqiA/YcfP family alpha/beta fold hydrolase [Burkholderiaceae bacterium]MDP3134637.1 YqiA/YcfP family alpha/beta fold hydrolase [Burkholderiaceae bacterium]MDZ4162135.1 YqiA/YcfP family alpha/beta fold hydrolase [Burkholderiales bacterium]
MSQTPPAPRLPSAQHLPRATHVLYLHGFRSSPRSMKAQKMADLMARQHPDVAFECPQLPPSPRVAMQEVSAQLARWALGPAEQLVVMGSSLGGFYATWVAERVPAAAAARVVLINPAVTPEHDLARHIGELTSWHNPEERFFFRPEFVGELRELHAGPLTQPQRYQVWAATGDEVLDWRAMQARYQACPGLQVVQGSDHALSDFDTHLPTMLAHMGIHT